MLAILIAMLFGGVSTKLITHQTSYCECYRSNFDGAYCKSLKGSGIQGSCHK
jgi:hypothetical protein